MSAPRTAVWRAACLALLALTACRRWSVPAASLPPELTPPPDSKSVDSRGDGKNYAVQYHLDAAYPAQPFLDGLTARLTGRGWKPMEHDFLNPDVPTSNLRGWTTSLDSRSKPVTGVHRWQGSWTNEKGDVVTYTLSYSVPANGIHVGPPDGQTDLVVNAFLLPAERVREMQAAAEKVRKK